MQQLISFFYRNKNFLFFIALEGLAIFFTIQSHSFHKSKFVNSANFVTGNIYQKLNNIKEFIHLKEENRILSEENVYLKNLLEKTEIDEVISDSLRTQTLSISGKQYRQNYHYFTAQVINNDYNKSNNYLTINAGSLAGIGPDMGVVNNKGIVGITKNVSDNFATVLSVLNVNARINVKLKKSQHFGTLNWNARDYTQVQLLDLPIQANIKKGDTVVTGGRSVIFPMGIPVGTVSDFKIENNNYSIVNIFLFNDMTALGYVEIIRNFDKEEILSLEEKSANE